MWSHWPPRAQEKGTRVDIHVGMDIHDIRVGTPGRLGRGLRGGKGLELPIDMDPAGGGHWQCLQWG